MILQPVGGGQRPAAASHLLWAFDWSLVAGAYLIGGVPVGSTVDKVVVAVNEVFDSLVLIEVGTLASPALLVLGVDSNLDSVGAYQVECDESTLGGQALYATVLIPGVSPSSGRGKVTVYLS